MLTIIRQATHQDSNHIEKILIQTNQPPPYEKNIQSGSLIQEIDDKIKRYDIYLVAEQDNQVVGLINGNIYQYLGKKACWIESLFVSTSHQQQGIGTKLINTIEELAQKAGAHKLELMAHIQAPARSFYQKSGFTPNGYRDIEKIL